MRIDLIYLKVLLFYWIHALQSVVYVEGGVTNASEYVYKKILAKRTLPFEDCGSKYDVLYVSLSSCTYIPCGMRRGSTVNVNVIFNDNGDNTSFLKHRVRWIFNAVKTDAAITPDPCDGDHECLTKINEGKSYWATVYVNTALPVIRGTMLWEAVDARSNEVICFKIPVVIQI